ncbi:MAG: class I SAM-dependent methyltransferase [Sphingomonadaceae bacterium]|nr:class I SAM-dependent methyltransferase [Sphingomonadaceae bacterium]
MTNPPAPVIQDWDGAAGAKWVAHQARLDRLLTPLGDAAMAAADIGAGDHILDIGCGAGTTSIALSERAGSGGRVLGLDISPDLLDAARRAARAHANIAFLLGDAAQASLPQGQFDRLFSRFGVMFFDDPIAAFRHLGGALKADGRLAFVCWRAPRENDWIRLPLAALDGLVELPATDPLAPGPFAFADAARTHDILTRAGFTDVAITPYDERLCYGHGADDAAAISDAMTMALTIGPFARAVAMIDGETRQRAEAALHNILSQRVADGAIYFDAAAWIVTARRG